MMPITRQSGFTLIELVITVALAGVLLGIGVPAMRDMMLTQRVKTASSDIHLSLMYARSEAIKRATNVTITPDNTAEWAEGWTIAAGGTTLRDQDPLNGVNFTGPAAAVTYNKLGRVTTAANFTVRVTGNDAVRMRCISVSLSGRPAIQTDWDGDPNDGVCD